MREPKSSEAFTAIIHGRVQGVGFRYHARSRALRLSLTGYVQNSSDGSVRVVCEGSDNSLVSMEKWLRHGPGGARVTAIDIQRHQAIGTYRTFTVEF